MQTIKKIHLLQNCMQMILYHWEENFNTWYDYTITLALKPIMQYLNYTVPTSDIYIVKSHTMTINRKSIKYPVLTPCYTQSRAPGCMTSCAASDGGG